MNDGDLLGFAEVQKAGRLIHELCELGHDPVQWHTHLLESLERMLTGSLGTAYIIRPNFDATNVVDAFQLHHNAHECWQRYLDVGDLTDQPHHPAIMARLGTDFTLTRQELVDDETWYASAFYKNTARPSNWDQLICSQVMIQSVGSIHGLGIARPVGAPAFGDKESALLKYIHSELAYLWRKPEAVAIDSLSRRLRETISCMQRGLGRKDIAEELGISAHTVHTYERQLFRTFNVNSRGELLARIAKAIRPILPA